MRSILRWFRSYRIETVFEMLSVLLSAGEHIEYKYIYIKPGKFSVLHFWIKSSLLDVSLPHHHHF